MTVLEEEILNIINCAINGCYIRKLKVWIEEDEPDCNECKVPVEKWYHLALEMHQDMSPMVLGYQGTEDGFKDFIDKEFRSRQMQRASYWEGFMHLPHLECDETLDCPSNFDTDLIL